MVFAYLALKEMWRVRGRFFLASLVIALITMLVLFTAALADGLGNGNKEYIEKLNGELVVYKADVDLSIAASQLDRSALAQVRRVNGVEDAGQVSFTSAVVLYDGANKLNVSLIGVEPGRPGEPPVVTGAGLEGTRSKEAIVDRKVSERTGLQVGDTLTIKSIQGTKDELYTLRIVGVADGRQYSLQPTVIVSQSTLARIRPGPTPNANPTDLISNIIVVKLASPFDWKRMSQALEAQVPDIRAVDRKTAYENTPGYSAQQSTLNTQQMFSFLIGLLVIGGFFQIQILQKIPQIGMLKAIGAGNVVIALAVLAQIVLVTLAGVAMGTFATLALALSVPSTVPVAFSMNALAIGAVSFLAIGPIGGLVSVHYALGVEPLVALGLN